MKATVLVRPKPGILDPQGQAVESSLRHLGFEVGEARVGRLVDVELETDDRDEARAQLERMCEQLLTNPLIESYAIELDGGVNDEPAPAAGRSPVVVFPGSNDDRDAQLALERLGAQRRASGTPRTQLPAGTAPSCCRAGSPTATTSAAARSRGSRRSCGRSAAFAADGGLVLGICNGFQILTEAGLLPGALRPNASLSFVCRDVALQRRANRHAVHLALRAPSSSCRSRSSTATAAGSPTTTCSHELDGERPARAALRVGRQPERTRSPTWRAWSTPSGNVFGLMPHPEHAVDPLLGSTDGALILGSLVDAARLSLAAAV